MATSTFVLGTSAPAAAIPAAGLSSRSAFAGCSVQFAPPRRLVDNANRTALVVQAKRSEDEGVTAKKVLASVLAAGAAITIAGQAMAANPIDLAKNKAGEVVSGAQSAASNLPNLPNVELPNSGAIENAGKAAEGVVSEIKGRIDGIFGKNIPFPSKNQVASTNGGTGSAIGDAKKRLANFPGKNAFAENLSKTTQEFGASIPRATGENSGSARSARELLGKDSTRVDAATRKVERLGSDIKNKAGEAVEQAKGFVGSVQDATPNAPNLPSPPQLPSLPNPFEGAGKSAQDIKGKVGSLKGNLTSKASDVKGSVASGKKDAKRTVASKVDEAKGNVRRNLPSDVTKGAEDLIGSAQGAAEEAKSSFPSLPNPFEGLQGNAGDLKEKVSEGSKDMVGSAQEAASGGLPSIPNPLENFKSLTGN